jgi:hypothetical protein
MVTEFPFGPFKCRIVDVTFDNAYLTGGEVLTAAALGWKAIHFAFCENAVNVAGTLGVNLAARPNATRTQVAIQAYETAGTVDLSHKEVTSGADLSTYTGRVMLLGY